MTSPGEERGDDGEDFSEGCDNILIVSTMLILANSKREQYEVFKAPMQWYDA